MEPQPAAARAGAHLGFAALPEPEPEPEPEPGPEPEPEPDVERQIALATAAASAAFSPDHLSISWQSGADDDLPAHFLVHVVAEHFEGMALLQRQRAVREVVAGHLCDGSDAEVPISIRAKTAAQAQQQRARPRSNDAAA